jgi:DNA-binding transcriptional ArsR family regulator
MEARRDVFQAISDPTRRQIIGMIAGKPMNLNAIADQFDISRPAVSQQIKILTECGLVTIRREGRERFCEARLEQLADVTRWVEQYRLYWDKKYDRLDKYLNTIQVKKKKSPKK